MTDAGHLSVPIRFVTRDVPVRRGEPVTLGLPWPRGAVADPNQFRLISPDGSPRPLQTDVLDRWPDGSVRWCLFDFLATTPNDGYRITVGGPEPPAGPPLRHRESTADDPLTFDRIETAGGTFVWQERDPFGQFLAFEPTSGGRVTAGLELGLAGSDPDATWIRYPLVRIRTVRSNVDFTHLRSFGLNIGIRIEVFAGCPVARIHLTVTNPQPADHPGGNWDLGNGGSIDISNLAVTLNHSLTGTIRCSPRRGQPTFEAGDRLTVRQYSSGGANWKSANHIDRHRKIPLTHAGYQLESENRDETGDRATPTVAASDGLRTVGVAMPTFWENFPKAITASTGQIVLHLFPEATELQGGEQKTHDFYLAFDADTITDEPLAWCRSPLVAHADPEWYAASGAIPYLTPKATDPNGEYLKLVDQAIEGSDTFAAKREKIDEFGWRHWGDLYGDHEAVGWPGPEPMVSHYNNQYDCVGGFATQFLRSGDVRWFDEMLACADHTCDIDIYHTDDDKVAYNRGLFWHTYHYAPADTATHRSYPRSLRTGPQGSLTEKMDELGETAAKLKKAYAVGGGPAASHNYNAGLMLAYFLTGNPLYYNTAFDLAWFVIAMEDPTKTPFRILSRQPTGLATESGGGGYHGPGRAAGNSILALLVGHQLSGVSMYLSKAEELIRRVVSPSQNLDRLDLLNAELRWFYTMTLQALGRYLDYKIELGQLDREYSYARRSLLHYAKWMAAKERPILDTPEKLQYPNETWAAQDMRKVEVFQFAAKHATGDERAQYLERAEWFFRYVERALAGFPTKSLCRPVVLMMAFGWSRAWWQANPAAIAPPPAVADETLPPWSMFVPQKAIAVRRAKMLVVGGAIIGVVAVVAGVAWLFG